MQKKLLLIDGHSILNRAFYGIPVLTNAEGLHTNAVYGFLNIMFKVLEEEQPQFLMVAFDEHAPTFRHEMYDAYKGTRKSMPEELREQVPVIREVLAAMEIPIVTLAGYEADDLLGTLSRKGEAAGAAVTILSGDRDLLQLATDSIKIRIPRTSRGKTEVSDYFAADVKAEYEVTPEEFIDLKALMGDSSDNIPGLPGVGIKTATKLIVQYHSIDGAYAHVDEIKPKKAQDAFREHFDLAVLSKDLARIRLDAPVEFDEESAKIGTLYTPAAYDWFRKLEFRNLLTRFDEENRQTDVIPEVQIMKDLGWIDEVLRRAERAPLKGLSLLQTADRILGMGLALPGDQTELYYIPLDGFVSGMYLAAETRQLLSSGGCTAAFDLKEILKAADAPENEAVMDVAVAAYLLDPLRPDYPYDQLAAEYAGLTIPAAEELFGSRKLPAAGQMTEEKAAQYTAYRALAAALTAEPLKKRLEETGMDELFRTVEMPLVWTLADIERAGMKINQEELQELSAVLGSQIETIEARIYEAAGEQFNINSPKQLGVILFEKMQLPGGKKTKTGYSTAADVLEKLAPEVPMVADILEYRQLTKLKSTYADALGGYVAADGRIHSNFNQTITATGRISSNEPNLQNIPVRMELGRQIRRVFVPEEGNVYIDADYSQIELRVLAAMSGDEKLIAAYREAKDIHRITASQVFHVPFDEVTDLQRRNAKAVNFGIVYGISSFGLSQGLSIGRKEAAEYIEHYFETYPAIKAFLDGLVADAKDKGYAETLFGRRRPIPELSSGNFMQRSFGERVAMNSPIQGTAADIIKIAMNRVHRRLRDGGFKARLILQVHDELLIEAPEAEKEAVCRLLEEEMVHAADLAVALVADVHTGYSWYEAK
ncbi:MAG: DNA polymerase I [Eubacterium sp.]|nr:DNA polymerase I [Eubacterium sp.]